MMLGYVEQLIHFNREADRSRQEEALRLSPNLADAHLAYGNYLVTVGRYGDALDEARYALLLDPASEYVHVHANWLRYITGRFDEALSGLDAAAAQAVGPLITKVRGDVLVALGRAREAVACFRRVYEQMPITWVASHVAWALAAAGMEREARAALRELHDREAREYVWPLMIAPAYAYLGEMEVAFDYLERSYEDRAAWIQMPYSPTFDPFRGDPRFDALVRRIGAIAPSH
jgi:tetratricopeptide (TPR) repeat protein